MANKPQNPPDLERFPRDSDGDPHGIVPGIAEIAAAFGRKKTTVTNWRYQGMPKEADGTFDLKKIALWKKGRKMDPETINEPQNGEAAAHDLLVAKRESEARLAQAKASRAERENLVAENRMVDRHDVNNFFASFFAATRDGLMKIPVEMSATFPADCRDDIVDLLTKRLELFLKTLHAQQSRLGDLEATQE